MGHIPRPRHGSIPFTSLHAPLPPPLNWSPDSGAPDHSGPGQTPPPAFVPQAPAQTGPRWAAPRTPDPPGTVCHTATPRGHPTRHAPRGDERFSE